MLIALENVISVWNFPLERRVRHLKKFVEYSVPSAQCLYMHFTLLKPTCKKIGFTNAPYSLDFDLRHRINSPRFGTQATKNVAFLLYQFLSSIFFSSTSFITSLRTRHITVSMILSTTSRSSWIRSLQPT